MKTLYVVGGTMGVGKTTVCQILKRRLANCVFLDGDWCWDMDPFQVTEETRHMVLDNICHLLGNFLRCAAYENVVFCWVLHQQDILDTILSRLPLAGVEVCQVSLLCEEESLRERLGHDVTAGVRTEDVVERSVARLPLYRRLRGEKLDVSHLTPEETARALLSQWGRGV